MIQKFGVSRVWKRSTAPKALSDCDHT